MTRFILSAATAALLIAAPAASTLASTSNSNTLVPSDRSHHVQLSQAAQTEPDQGSATVSGLNEQSLKNSRSAVKRKSAGHHASNSHSGKHRAHANAPTGRTETGDAAVERLNEESLRAAKSGQSAGETGTSPGQSSTPQ